MFLFAYLLIFSDYYQANYLSIHCRTVLYQICTDDRALAVAEGLKLFFDPSRTSPWQPIFVY